MTRRFCTTAQSTDVRGSARPVLSVPDTMEAPLRKPLDTAGLSTAQAADRLTQFGPNEAGNGKRSPIAQLLPLLGNPLALVLLVASGLSALLGDKVDAALIASMVAFSVVINLVQTWRSQKAAEKLRLQVAPTASVLRDGIWQELPRRQVVPGDVVRLGAGDLVPADARLLEARDLHVQEAALTGESLPADKSADVPDGDARGTVWLGTSVVSGTATARVLATGPATQFGDVVARLAARAPETEFERGLRHFGLLITRTVLVLVLVILAASLAMHRPAFESLLFAVALAVGLTPEFLPDDHHGDPGAGRGANGAPARHRQKALGHPGSREHRHPVQRQDRDPHVG